MKKNRLLAILLVLAMALALLSGCGTDTASSAPEAPASGEETQTPVPETPAETPEAPASDVEASAVETPADSGDNTEANANMDFKPHQEMLKGLTTTLPVTDEDVTLTYFMGFETNSLNYIDGGDLMNHQVWTWLRENSGVNIDLRVVDKTQQTDQFNLMLASGDYTDLLNIGDYAAGTEAAYDEDIIIDLGEYLETEMPNYNKIIHSDQTVLEEVQDGDMFLRIYPIKDQIANPTGIGAFIRMDWLEDLDMEVPQTYDELTEVLRAFKTEKNASEPMAMFNTVAMQNGLLSGGFGALAELSANAMGTNFANSFYQEDGEVVYGATSEGIRKYLSWLHELYTENLINFENMQNRETNPFSDLNAGKAADGSNGYIFSNQPFGGNYSTMAADQYGDDKCNWWPVQDVAEEAGQTIPFFEENSMVDSTGATALSISSKCDNVEVALQFLDYGYSYEGSLLYNFGFQKGSGHEVETWDFNEEGVPTFDAEVMNGIASTNIASSIIATKDLAGVVFDARLAFEFGERELNCFEAWSTNKNTSNNLGSDVQLTSEEMTDASAIYSDIITYVGTSALQFINGDLDVDNDSDWDNYVSTVEGMNLEGLTEIIQAAYDRDHD